MTSFPQLSADIEQLVARLNQAVALVEPQAICDEVKASLIEVAMGMHMPDELLEPAPDRYARRLLHRCPSGTYSVMAMTWGPGQGTPVHDHAGKWCVECLLEGQIEITTYEPVSDLTASVVQFAEVDTQTAHPGDVGILVPPMEYHRIRNVSDRKAVTVHVYQGEMLWCHAFHALESGGYRRERLTLDYSE
ncbi:MAG: cysteine dioxygenase [Gemmatimonadales bacterium]|nr:cysteine dioxygenase [Gemmatimonadales bacterium]NIN10485.1 cysteine dioxygenase [Gemmatimonadales bacterium]NIN49272.1 cysteine dioxygenase [Gemmatimonadales bacterium]NIP06736.1 cysteine dioxygenase [Gemmatimonadales bacterium]NIR02762.1 cysteine dioxygenase [Gemmatimonadales bacterium]